MDTGVARMNCAARSSQWNSGRLRIMSMQALAGLDAEAPGGRPRPLRPAGRPRPRSTPASCRAPRRPSLRSATWSGMTLHGVEEAAGHGLAGDARGDLVDGGVGHGRQAASHGVVSRAAQSGSLDRKPASPRLRPGSDACPHLVCRRSARPTSITASWSLDHEAPNGSDGVSAARSPRTDPRGGAATIWSCGSVSGDLAGVGRARGGWGGSDLGARLRRDGGSRHWLGDTSDTLAGHRSGHHSTARRKPTG